MASIKKYDEKSKEKLEPLKAALVESKELEKTKVIKAEVAKDKYTLSSADAVEIKEKERTLVSKAQSFTDYKNLAFLEELALKDKDRKDASNGGITQKILTELKIYRPVETTTIKDIKTILEKREIIAAASIVNFDLDYNIEIIPTPDTNKIYSLGTVEKNIYDVPVFGKNVDTNKFQETHKLKNFIGQVGGAYNIVVSGVEGTQFELVVFNETNGTYYNWNEVSEVIKSSSAEDFISVVAGSFQNGVNYYRGVIGLSGKEIITIHIPTVIKETVYRLGFLPTKERELVTDYGGLPVFGDEAKPLYKITQLPRSSTTIGFVEKNRLGITAGELTINHTPGAKLNSSNTTRGKYNIEISVNSKKEISLANGMLNGIVGANSFVGYKDNTEILDIELTASISKGFHNLIGTIKGTITLGKSSLRPSVLQIIPSDVFTTDPHLI